MVLLSTGIAIFFYNNHVFRGTVTYVNIDGGFYGIVDNRDNGFEPINLPEEFKTDGLTVFVVAQKCRDLGSYHMWGETVEIRFIKIL